MEKLARYLALHLIAVILASEANAGLLKYLLSGFQLLHSLSDLASRNPKIEQVGTLFVGLFMWSRTFLISFTQLLASTRADLVVAFIPFLLLLFYLWAKWSFVFLYNINVFG